MLVLAAEGIAVKKRARSSILVPEAGKKTQTSKSIAESAKCSQHSRSGEVAGNDS